jgi:hypothetical protein
MEKENYVYSSKHQKPPKLPKQRAPFKMVNPYEVQESGRTMGVNTKKLFSTEDNEAELKKNF